MDLNIFLKFILFLTLVDFGLTVVHRLHVMSVAIPGRYMKKICGLCGNFNQNAADDMFIFGTTRRGSYAQVGDSFRQDYARDDK